MLVSVPAYEGAKGACVSKSEKQEFSHDKNLSTRPFCSQAYWRGLECSRTALLWTWNLWPKPRTDSQ